MQLNLNHLTPETFINEYWQKKPLVIKQGLKNFHDLLSPEEMAGLACEEQVESRRVYKSNDQWQAEFGPFDCYDHLGSSGWTLIVQALNNWLPQANELISCFDFIPRWRFDDVMVSFGTPGGGVGPHIDLYDVFICQGSGRRQWRVGDKGEHQEFSAHPALLHTKPFDAIIDVELETGDILYIPPGFPHDGISLENSMSFSVGYRTDSAQSMFSALADHTIDRDLNLHQITDPDRDVSHFPGLINKQDFARIKSHLIESLDDKLLSEFAGAFLTRSKCPLDIDGNIEGNTESSARFSIEEITEILAGQPLIKLGGIRCLYFENYKQTGAMYINGEQTNLPVLYAALIPMLCDQFVITLEQIAQVIDNKEFNDSVFAQLLVSWVNKGYWYFEQ